MQRFSFSSLRVRLFLLVLCALLPALGVILYTASEQRRAASAQVTKDMIRLADLAAKDLDDIFVAARDLLVALKRFDQVLNGDAARCGALFVQLQEEFDKYTNFGVVNPNGEIICASHLPVTPINVTDRSWFRHAKATREFTVGDYEINVFTSQPSISFAQPIVNPSGTVKAIIFATMNLEWLQSFASRIELPARATLNIIDRNDTTLVHFSESETPAAESIPEALFFRTILTKGHGVAEAIGSDGATHVFGFTPINAVPATNLYLIVSVPKGVAFTEPNRILRQNLFVLGLLALVALATTWIGGELVFLRRINVLVTATKQIAAANFSVRTRLLHSKDELG